MDLENNTWNEGLLDDIFGTGDEKTRLAVFMLDCSGSMEGTIIGAVNSIMEELLEELCHRKDDAYVFVAEFGGKSSFSSDRALSLKSFSNWQRVKTAGFTQMGRMFREMADLLISGSFCPSGKGGIAASFILFSDGLATDDIDEGLKMLKRSGLFRNARRLAVNFSEFWDKELLQDFAGGAENVLNLKANEANKAKRKIQDFLEEA